jgi:hypothetical protein
VHGYASPLCTPIHDYGCSYFLQLARDIFEKLAGYPPANAVTRPGRQYTNPFRLPASRDQFVESFSCSQSSGSSALGVCRQWAGGRAGILTVSPLSAQSLNGFWKSDGYGLEQEIAGDASGKPLSKTSPSLIFTVSIGERWTGNTARNSVELLRAPLD